MRYLPIFLMLTWSLQALALELDGETDFAQKLEINASISARIDTVPVGAGERVQAGALLVKLVDTGYRTSVDYARARVDGLAPMVARMRTELEKAQELYDRDSLALVELQRAEQDHAMAVANLLAAQAQLQKAEYELSQTEIRAPIDGTVLEVHMHPGEYVNTAVSDRSLITLAEDRQMIARALLPAEYWARDLLKRRARISLPSRSFEGRIVTLGRNTIIGNNNHPAVVLEVRFDARGEVPARLPVRISIADD